eukprot:593229-Pyramimonas_sp.AAC.1
MGGDITLVDSLKAAIAQSTDDDMKLTLEKQLKKLTESALCPDASISPAELVRQTHSAWKDADTKHEQAVMAVRRLRERLEAAEIRESEAAKVLARATIDKMQAAQRLASSEGVLPTDGAKNGKSLFNLSWDPTLFSNIEQMDCEQAEKD